jgi:PEGA domain
MRSRTDVPLSWLFQPRRLGVLVLTFVLGLSPARLWAQVSPERLEQAKALFRQGNALLSAGDPERALERFLASREAVASGKNTANAAICLERLGRYDEALDMYEELLARFSADLDEQDRQNLAPIMGRLRAGLGSLDISSNVEALVTIDGKPRGRLPRATALRALPGKRRVRIVNEGYRTFDVVVNVRAGESVAVDASLEPLSGLGALRVEQAGAEPVQLLVDGKPVGNLPWEGTLRVGGHLLQALGKDRGSKPQAVQVIERKTQLIRVSVRALGPPVQLLAGPTTALLRLDDVPLGPGKWSGRLPLGSYVVSAHETGYFAREKPLAMTPASAPTTLRLELERDAKSARWPQKSPFRYTTGVGAAFMYAPKLNGGQENSCPELCRGSRAATGARFEASFEVLHELGIGAELGAGYLFAEQSFTRAAFATTRPPAMTRAPALKVSYALDEQLVLGGGYVRAAAVARLPLPRGFKLRTALGAAVVAASYEARAKGFAWTSGTELAVAEGYGYTRISELLPVVTTTIRLERALGPLRLALGIDAWFALKNGPRFPDVGLQVSPNCAPEAPQAVGCAPLSDLLSGEQVHGLFATLLPEASVRYAF